MEIESAPKGEPVQPQAASLAGQPLAGWKVLLHDVDGSFRDHVVDTLVMLTPLDRRSAAHCMREAEKQGVAVVLVTYRERAELYQEQFANRGLIASVARTG